MDLTRLLFNLAPNGTGWTLFVLMCYVAYRLYQDRVAESAARLQDLKDLSNKFQAAIEKMSEGQTAALEQATRVADATYLVVQNLQRESGLRK